MQIKRVSDVSEDQSRTGSGSVEANQKQRILMAPASSVNPNARGVSTLIKLFGPFAGPT